MTIYIVAVRLPRTGQPGGCKLKTPPSVIPVVAADKLSQGEWDWIKLMKPMDPPPVMVAKSMPERRGDTAALTRLQTTEA